MNSVIEAYEPSDLFVFFSPTMRILFNTQVLNEITRLGKTVAPILQKKNDAFYLSTKNIEDLGCKIDASETLGTARITCFFPALGNAYTDKLLMAK